MKKLLNFIFVSVVLSWSLTSYGVTQNKISFGPFSESINKTPVGYRSFHDAARVILKQKHIHPRFKEVGKFFLSQKNQLMPKIKVSGKTLSFSIKGKKVTAKHKSGNIFIINGNEVNALTFPLDQKNANFNLHSLFFAEAQAAIPMAAYYFGTIMIAIFWSGACINSGVTSTFSLSGSNSAKWTKAKGSLDYMFNSAIKQMKRTCPGAANASHLDNNYKVTEFFESYCRGLGKKALAMYEEKSRVARRADGSVNPQVFRFAAQRPHQIAPRGSIGKSLETASFQQCQDEYCNSTLNTRFPFSSLDENIQETLNSHETVEFNRECINWGLQMETGLEGSNGKPHQSTNPARSAI